MTRKSADGDPRQSIAVRTRSDLKQRLEAIARQNGHSLGQECELRLEASLSAGSDLRTLIREEIRATLAERGDVIPGELPVHPAERLYRY